MLRHAVLCAAAQGVASPQSEEHLEECRRRLAFQELLALQLRLLLQRHLFRHAQGVGGGEGVGRRCGKEVGSSQSASTQQLALSSMPTMPPRFPYAASLPSLPAPAPTHPHTPGPHCRLPKSEAQLAGIRIRDYSLAERAVNALPYQLTGGWGRQLWRFVPWGSRRPGAVILCVIARVQVPEHAQRGRQEGGPLQALCPHCGVECCLRRAVCSHDVVPTGLMQCAAASAPCRGAAGRAGAAEG